MQKSQHLHLEPTGDDDGDDGSGDVIERSLRAEGITRNP
jgi:hypothetical protein